jgi:hypothetical protein
MKNHRIFVQSIIDNALDKYYGCNERIRRALILGYFIEIKHKETGSVLFIIAYERERNRPYCLSDKNKKVRYVSLDIIENEYIMESVRRFNNYIDELNNETQLFNKGKSKTQEKESDKIKSKLKNKSKNQYDKGYNAAIKEVIDYVISIENKLEKTEKLHKKYIDFYISETGKIAYNYNARPSKIFGNNDDDDFSYHIHD